MSSRMSTPPTPSKRFPTERDRETLLLALGDLGGGPYSCAGYVRDLIIDLHGRIEQLEEKVKYLESEDRFNKGLPG